MTFNIATIVLNAEAEAFMSLFDGGFCELRSGAQPAAITDGATGTLIATINLPGTALDSPAVSGVASLATTVESAAIADSTIGWARFKKSDGASVFDGSVTLSGGGGDVIATLVDLLIDDLVNIVSMSYARS